MVSGELIAPGIAVDAVFQESASKIMDRALKLVRMATMDLIAQSFAQ